MLNKPHILSLILNLFTKFNNTWALLLDPLFFTDEISEALEGGHKYPISL